MATSKTLTPTNVTIQIPDFTDQPDQRVNSNCIDKEADAINALNGKISDLNNMKFASWVRASGGQDVINCSAFVLFGCKNSSDQANNRFCYYGFSQGNALRGGFIYGSDASWLGLSYDVANSKLTLTNNASSYCNYVIFYA